MIQGGGMFTHLDIPKVCSHTNEVEFDSQQDDLLWVEKYHLLWVEKLMVHL